MWYLLILSTPQKWAKSLGGKIPWSRKWQPDSSFQHLCLEKSHGQRSLVDYSPWGCKDLDMTESTHTHSPATTKSFTVHSNFTWIFYKRGLRTQLCNSPMFKEIKWSKSWYLSVWSTSTTVGPIDSTIASLIYMGLQRVGHNWATELNWIYKEKKSQVKASSLSTFTGNMMPRRN